MKPVKGKHYWWPRLKVALLCKIVRTSIAQFAIVGSSEAAEEAGYVMSDVLYVDINTSTGHLYRDDPFIGVIRELPTPAVNMAVARGILRAAADLPRTALRSPKRVRRANAQRGSAVPRTRPVRATSRSV